MAKFGIGQPVRRVEDQRFLTGQGRYVDDIVLPGMLHACNVLSPHAHAKIKKIDVVQGQGRARRAAGADRRRCRRREDRRAHLASDAGGFRRAQGPPHLPAAASSADRVRHVGDRVAFVVAETLTQARDAAELVEVDYEPLPAVVNIEDAAKPDAPKVWDDNPAGNNAFRLMFGNKEATDAAFARRQARRQAPRREQPPVAGLDGAARRDRRLQPATDETTRSIPPRRIRTARAWRSRTSSTCRRTASAWCRPTSAAASA